MYIVHKNYTNVERKRVVGLLKDPNSGVYRKAREGAPCKERLRALRFLLIAIGPAILMEIINQKNYIPMRYKTKILSDNKTNQEFM